MKHNFKIFSILISIIFSACKSSNNENKIKIYNPAQGGGEIQSDTDNVAIRTVALVEKNHLSDGLSLCSGTIIEDDIVLTAAHCFMGKDPKNIVLVFNKKVNAAKSHQIRPLAGLYVHEDFSPSSAQFNTPNVVPNDIALVRFEGRLPDLYTIAYLLTNLDKIPQAPESANTNTTFGKLTLAGYGRSNNQATSMGILRAVDVFVKEIDETRKIIKTFKYDGSQALPGDSGGPAFVFENDNTYVAGVDSTSDMEKTNKYTAVPLYLDWIETAKDKIKNQELGKPIKLSFDSQSLQKSLLKPNTLNYTVVASNFSEYSGDCKLSLMGTRKRSSFQEKYNLLSEKLTNEASFSIEPKQYKNIIFNDNKAKTSDQYSQLVELTITWSCNGLPNQYEKISISNY